MSDHHVTLATRLFKWLLIIQAVLMLIYTLMVFYRNGFNFVAVFINNVLSVTWNGQFSLDFACYLTLSALWIIWRNQFQPKSIIIAVLAMILGILVFAPYLLYLLIREKGDVKKCLIGNR